MNFADPVPGNIIMSRPFFRDNAVNLNHYLRELDSDVLKKTMRISDKLVGKVHKTIHSFTGNQEHGRHAVFAYRGAVFKSLDALSLDKKHLLFAQDHIRIISALYGVLKPFDSIEEYRLDMKTPLRTSEASNLYDYWQKPLIDYFSRIETPKIIINLASTEFSKTIDFSILKIRVIDISFGELADSSIKSPPMYSKMARGTLTGYIIRNLITEPEKIKKFDSDGYTFNTKLSKDSKFVFTR